MTPSCSCFTENGCAVGAASASGVDASILPRLAGRLQCLALGGSVVAAALVALAVVATPGRLVTEELAATLPHLLLRLLRAVALHVPMKAAQVALFATSAPTSTATTSLSASARAASAPLVALGTTLRGKVWVLLVALGVGVAPIGVQVARVAR